MSKILPRHNNQNRRRKKKHFVAKTGKVEGNGFQKPEIKGGTILNEKSSEEKEFGTQKSKGNYSDGSNSIQHGVKEEEKETERSGPDKKGKKRNKKRKRNQELSNLMTKVIENNSAKISSDNLGLQEPTTKKRKLDQTAFSGSEEPVKKSSKIKSNKSFKRVWKKGKWKKLKDKKEEHSGVDKSEIPIERLDLEGAKPTTSAPSVKSAGKHKDVPLDVVSSNWKAFMKEMNISEQKKEEPWQVVETSRRKRGFKDSPTKPDIWFDDVDPALIEIEEALTAQKQETIQGLNEAKRRNSEPNNQSKMNMGLVKEGATEGLTKCVAMDCEMVGIGYKGEKSMLARVSIVNQFGVCIYDKHVLPREQVTDYRTPVSGIRPKDIRHGEDFMKVQKEVHEIIKDRILVGHAIKNDLQVLFLSHPKRDIRDTSTYKPFKTLFKGNKPSLKKLSEAVLKMKIQDGEHNSVEDAQAAMRLYTLHRIPWEKSLQKFFKKPKPRK